MRKEIYVILPKLLLFQSEILNCNGLKEDCLGLQGILLDFLSGFDMLAKKLQSLAIDCNSVNKWKLLFNPLIANLLFNLVQSILILAIITQFYLFCNQNDDIEYLKIYVFFYFTTEAMILLPGHTGFADSISPIWTNLVGEKFNLFFSESKISS